MKNSELIQKLRKEGISKLTDFELRRLANVSWKADVFTLNALTKYVRSGKNDYMNALLAKHGISPDVITTTFVTKHCKANDLVRKEKNDKGVLFPTNEKKRFFSLWFISGVVQNYAATIKAAAQSGQPVKVEKPAEKTEVEKAAAEAEAAAKKVEQNKRSNKAKAEAAAKKKRSEAAKKAAETRKANKAAAEAAKKANRPKTNEKTTAKKAA